ncbi:CoA-disulfide reductase [Geobacillus genomosp. 3]|uniref:CoA-disulfide reductase n=1 Tax=Geobacillus genomosp. 3 TaxID=1921421 RepID=S5Z0A7_GEOG3|nr:CoA-disulfide reductase [Geobacillus genomosp. 3]AGT32389.1 CoA-disulfide reductase [Geobacillus genomosp. 3]
MRKIVIVGGVAGGATAAARLRRLNEEDHIVLFERGEYISFANCGLPYYIGGVIEERNKLLVQTAEGMSKRFRLDIRPLNEVTAIHRDRKTVSVRNVKTGEEYEETYDILILSPGAKPIVPPIPGIEEAEALFTLRTVPDTDRIKAYIDEQKPRRAVVVGGGFIGVEMAENLTHRGIHVTLVERANQVMAPIDYEMAAIVHGHMREHGVELLLGNGVQALEARGRRVVLTNGHVIETDMIILAIGVEPENRLAKEAGLELGVRGAIKVNEYLQTSDPSIYAIGDAVEVRHYIRGFETFVPLAWPANRQGRLVADHIHGYDVKYSGTLGTSIAKVFELAVAATGLNEKTLRSLHIPYEVVHIHPPSHAGYYPNAETMTFKLIFDRETGRIYGAQVVGKEGADKRIDVIATAIKGGLTVRDIPDLELAYAPPFSSAKDPVNMAGYVASNMMDGLVETVQWHEIDKIVEEGGILIDVRTAEETARGMIHRSIHIPLDELRERLQELPQGKTIYVICQAGLRGYIAVRILRSHGFQAKNVDGGYRLYAAVKQS